VDRPGVLLLRLADRLILVRVDERPDALVREHLAEQPLLGPAVDDVDPRHPALGRPHRVLQLGDAVGVEPGPALLEDRLGLLDGELAEELAAQADARLARQVDELHGPQRPGDLDRHRVGVESVRLPLAVAAQGRDDRDDVVLQQGL
jgi:hypothetical protein